MVPGELNSRKSVAPDDADSLVDTSRGLDGLRRMAWLFAVMLVGLLPGCAQFEAQKEREALDATVATAVKDDEVCQSSGAKPGTPRYLHCRLNLSYEREPPKQRLSDDPTR